MADARADGTRARDARDSRRDGAATADAASTVSGSSDAPAVAPPPPPDAMTRMPADAPIAPVPTPPPDAMPAPPAVLVDARPPPPPDAGPPPDAATPPPVTLRIVRARNVKADRLIVGVVYADKLHAKGGTVLTSGDPLPDRVLAAQLGQDDLKVDLLIADILYARDIHADSVLIREAHVADLKLK